MTDFKHFNSFPLNSEFLEDLRSPERVAFIFYLPSFLVDLSSFLYYNICKIKTYGRLIIYGKYRIY